MTRIPQLSFSSKHYRRRQDRPAVHHQPMVTTMALIGCCILAALSISVDAFTPVKRSLAGDVLSKYSRTSSRTSSFTQPKPLEMVGTLPPKTDQERKTRRPPIYENDDEERIYQPTDVDKWMASASASSIQTTVEHFVQSDPTVIQPAPPLTKPAQVPAQYSPKLKLDGEGRLTIATPNENEQDLVLLEGLSTQRWSSADVAESETSADFSSLLLQTTVPSSAVKTLPLGDLVTCDKLLSAARLTRYWMGPKFGKVAKDIPVDTQFLLLQLTDDNEEAVLDAATPAPPKYAVMMPLVDGGCRSTLEGSELRNRKGKETALDLVTYSENGGRPDTAGGTMNAMYVAVGSEDPYQLIQRAFKEVSSTLGTFKPLSEKTIPSTVNDFGWCTWDAFYSRVHPKGILEGIKVLKDAGVPARNLILDDGWQHVSPQPEEWTTTRNTHELMEDIDEDDMAVVIEKANVTMHSNKFSQPALFLFAKVVGTAIFDFVARGLTHFYERHVQGSSHDSLASRIWTFLARKTVLKQGLWKYFEEETDFCRQLDDFEPNWKFTSHKDQESDEDKVGGDSNMSLGDLVQTLKSDLEVKKVYCWHALHGYWRGVTSELGEAIGINATQIFTKPSEKLLRMEPQMGYDAPTLFGAGLIDSKKDLKTFYDHLHGPLVTAGVDGVKVDVQSGVSAAGSGVKGENQLAMAYTQAMENSVKKRFPGDNGAVEVINCMCHSTENLYRYNTTAIARASDDFYPERPETWTTHLVNVAYNSLFMGEITLPDWDMFHSKHRSAELHGAARAIGGVPVYVSDVPGEHDVELLKKLVLPDGSILRAQNHGRPTRDCLFADVGQDGISTLKVWNTNRNEVLSGGKSGGGVVGAFNVQGVAWDYAAHDNRATTKTPPQVTATVKPHDVETLRPFDGPFAVWSHRSKSLDVLPTGSSIKSTTIDPQEWEAFTMEPIQQNEVVQWAPIGLGDMINSGAALSHVGALEDTVTTTNSTYGEDAGDGNSRQTTTAEITTRGPGRFVAFCQPSPSRIMINGKPPRLDFTHDEKTGLLVFMLPKESGEKTPHQVTMVWDQE